MTPLSPGILIAGGALLVGIAGFFVFRSMKRRAQEMALDDVVDITPKGLSSGTSPTGQNATDVAIRSGGGVSAQQRHASGAPTPRHAYVKPSAYLTKR